MSGLLGGAPGKRSPAGVGGVGAGGGLLTSPLTGANRRDDNSRDS